MVATNSVDNKLSEINKFIAKELWLDFEVKSFDGGTLIIVGGIDLYYNWLIELTFSTVDFILLKSDWMRKDRFNAIEKINGGKEESIKSLFLIDENCLIFAFNHRDVDETNNNQYIVASMEIDYKINNG